MDGYGVSVFVAGLELHADGRRRINGPLDWKHHVPLTMGASRRGEIRGFTATSRKRLAWALATAAAGFAVHVSLTYHARVDESDAKQVAHRNRALVVRAKKDLRRFLACVRVEAGRYAWVLEFQGRGAIHFHVLLERPLSHERASVVWCRATDQLDDPDALRHAVLVREIAEQTAVRRYLVKYFGKAGQKGLPPGVHRAGRFWGCSRSLRGSPLRSVVSCEARGLRHCRTRMKVVRTVRRFVSRAVGFRWHGGRIVCWDGELPRRALVVMSGAEAYYGASICRSHGEVTGTGGVVR